MEITNKPPPSVTVNPSVIRLSFADIQYAAMTSKEEADVESYKRVLTKSAIFHKAGLTPAFLYDVNNGMIYVTSDENLKKELN